MADAAWPIVHLNYFGIDVEPVLTGVEDRLRRTRHKAPEKQGELLRLRYVVATQGR